MGRDSLRTVFWRSDLCQHRRRLQQLAADAESLVATEPLAVSAVARILGDAVAVRVDAITRMSCAPMDLADTNVLTRILIVRTAAVVAQSVLARRAASTEERGCSNPSELCTDDFGNTTCVDVTRNGDHCGECGNVCPIHQPASTENALAGTVRAMYRRFWKHHLCGC